MQKIRLYDATKLANPVNVPRLEKEEKFVHIKADGENVGLPAGQMGNSEVGHLNLGAGRIVYQDLSKINNAIKDGSFFKNERFLAAVEHVKKNNSSLHIYGLVSTGGVHSSLDHVLALIKLAADAGLKKVYLHAFLDGRDTPPASACEYVQIVEDELKKYNLPPVATVIGRYYIMDRDNRWDRVEKGYNALLLGEGEHANSAIEGIKASYAKGETDEFVLPTVIGGEESRIHDNDSIIFFNYRPDRAREITKAINFENFDGFERKKGFFPLYFVCMTQYDATMPNVDVAFKPQSLTNTFGEYISEKGLTQLRIAETEKYAHVTFFFNGGVETSFKGEDRALIPSPKVATYDLKPEMSAYEVCDEVVSRINSGKYDVIILNYANCDMVGHTGVFDAAVAAVEAVDACVGKTVDAILAQGGAALITADHGNADQMYEPDGSPFTAHTTNPVPLIGVGLDGKGLKEGGKLADLAPTMLELLGLAKPAEMDGQSLLK